MFKPHYGKCKCHNEQRLIVVKAGWCAQGNARRKELLRTSAKNKVAKIKKPTNRTLSSIIDQLDEVYSIYIRSKDADSNGLIKCFTCPAIYPWKGGQMHCGHYFSRSIYALRWHEKNTKPQCVRCNITLKGNIAMYAQELVKLYGVDVLQELELKKNARFKVDRFNLLLLIGHYKTLGQAPEPI